MARSTKKNEALFMTATQFKEGNFDKAIIPLGSTEAHGLHLPIGTDTLVSYHLAKRIADECEGMMVLPPVVVSYSGNYDSFPFSMSLSYDTCTNVIYDYIESCVRNGITRIVMINNHDGNSAPAEIASRKIKEKYPQVRMGICDWWEAIDKHLPDDFFEHMRGSGHGGEFETSNCYYLFPEYCQPEYAADIIPELPDFIEMKWDFGELTDRGQTGGAKSATKEKGEHTVKLCVKLFSDEVKKLDANNWDYTTPGHHQMELK